MKSTKKKSLILIKINEFFSSREKKNIFLNKKTSQKVCIIFRFKKPVKKQDFLQKRLKKLLNHLTADIFAQKTKKFFGFGI